VSRRRISRICPIHTQEYTRYLDTPCSTGEERIWALLGDLLRRGEAFHLLAIASGEGSA
jgi:hypothetical protein